MVSFKVLLGLVLFAFGSLFGFLTWTFPLNFHIIKKKKKGSILEFGFIKSILVFIQLKTLFNSNLHHLHVCIL